MCWWRTCTVVHDVTIYGNANLTSEAQLSWHVGHQYTCSTSQILGAGSAPYYYWMRNHTNCYEHFVSQYATSCRGSLFHQQFFKEQEVFITCFRAFCMLKSFIETFSLLVRVVNFYTKYPPINKAGNSTGAGSCVKILCGTGFKTNQGFPDTRGDATVSTGAL